ENAKKIIALQKLQIESQRKLLLLSVCCLVLLSAFLFIFFFHYKEKRTINMLLNEQHKKITDSINYAKRIQQSILPRESEIQKIVPQSFIFYQPRDIVSGDFYWFSQVEKKIIIAAVDCTGHGVPGAFMSLIGNTLLNEIINEKRVTDPASILSLLHLNVLKALHQREGEVQNQDGMEMSLCVIDNENKLIEFAGAMTPIYVVKNGLVNVIQPDTRGIGGINAAIQKGEKVEFSTKQIPIEKNMCLYMFTDGYMDQFGGPKNKKFNAPMFKKMLLYFQALDMESQKSGMEEIMKNWRGDHRQIDDMLVIGIRF
ncbi:MAG: PP2C family protein-serine/threonine phosphatase, partial [Bacteroidota bacterium]